MEFKKKQGNPYPVLGKLYNINKAIVTTGKKKNSYGKKYFKAV